MSFTYNVNYMSSIDCYKRAETNATTLYTGSDPVAAYSFAVHKWTDIWADRMEDYMDPEDMDVDHSLVELLKHAHENGDCLDSLKAVHSYFEEKAYEIWEPEYINCPTEEVIVSVSDDVNEGHPDPAIQIERALDIINTALESQGLE